MKRCLFVCVVFLGFYMARGQEWPQVSGYVKYLPVGRVVPGADPFIFDHWLHNRINTQWHIHKNLSFQGALRTRLFQGYSVANIPDYASLIDFENGWLRPSAVLFQEGSWLMHTMSDRFFLDYSQGKWQVRVGRQRINWGINAVSNPNDLFNVYSFFDFDYEERPGTDAVRIQYFSSALSRVEFAYSPGPTATESVAAFLYSFNTRQYDIQFISGYFRNRYALGSGWAGSIGKTGFKGELTFFTDLQPDPDRQRSNIVIAISADHQFSNGSILMGEYLFNQKRDGMAASLLTFIQPLQADNLSFTDHALFVNYTYPLTPVVNLGAASFYFPRESGLFLSPNISVNMSQNVDFQFISQIFLGRSGTILSQAGYLFATAFKWSF